VTIKALSSEVKRGEDGALGRRVVDLAIAARARLAVLPCCHDLETGDCGGLLGWLDGPLAMDVIRAMRLRAAGYRVVTQMIPAEITPKYRLLLAEPGERVPVGSLSPFSRVHREVPWCDVCYRLHPA